MEFPEEFTVSNDHSLILKRKRTKRQRLSSASSLSTAAAASGAGDGVSLSVRSPTSSGDISTMNTEEDEDVANCLILLARGIFQRQVEKEEGEEGKIVKFSRRRLNDTAEITTGKSGFYVYECRTCNRSFPSFQALGGHRASHKKTKVTVEEHRGIPSTPPLFPPPPEEKVKEGIKSTKLDSHIRNRPKIHECSICGSEFSSGQALGGHMRRHRAAPPPTTTSIDTNTTESNEERHDKNRNNLPLDLNLPAPLELEDDHHHYRDIKFEFDRSKECLVFSGPALVDCHY